MRAARLVWDCAVRLARPQACPVHRRVIGRCVYGSFTQCMQWQWRWQRQEERGWGSKNARSRTKQFPLSRQGEGVRGRRTKGLPYNCFNQLNFRLACDSL